MDNRKVTDCCLTDCSYDFYNPYCKGEDCPDQYRDIVGPECLLPVTDYCLGEGLRTEDWIRAWTAPGKNPQNIPDCVYLLSRFLLLPTPPIAMDISQGPPLPDLFRSSFFIDQGEGVMEKVFKAYEGKGFVLGSPPNSRTFSPLEYSLYNVCHNVPGICKGYLRNFCSPYRGEDLIRNPALAKWCGCYLPDAEYSKYVDSYQITKECTPYCIREESVPVPLASGNAPSLCKQNVCVLDDITVDLQNSTVRGGVNFRQVCGDCGESGVCSCIISRVNIKVVNSEIQGIDFTQKCGKSSKCTQKVGPLTIEVPCEIGENVAEEFDSALRSAYIARNTQILLWILGAIVLVGLAWAVFSLWRGGRSSSS